MTTFALNNGLAVLAGGNGEPIRYTNRTQAERRASELRAEGVNASVWRSPYLGRVFYVAIV